MGATLPLDVVAELAGAKPQLLRDWIASGLIVPAVQGGKNRSHRFTYMQAVGIVVAARTRASERGCVTDYVGQIVGAFAAVPDRWLWEQFSKGRTHLVTVHRGTPLLTGGHYDWVDVQKAHREVLYAVTAIEEKTGRPTRNRPRQPKGWSNKGGARSTQ